MSNPFDAVDQRLSSIENLLASLQSNIKPPARGNESEEPIFLKEAATFLGLSEQTIYIKVSNQELPYHKPDKLLYFFKSELVAYIRSGTVKTAAMLKSEADSLQLKGRK